MAKLQEPKFDVDQIVYVEYKGSVMKTKIVAITIIDDKFEYFIFGIWYDECDVHKTLKWQE